MGKPTKTSTASPSRIPSVDRWSIHFDEVAVVLVLAAAGFQLRFQLRFQRSELIQYSHNFALHFEWWGQDFDLHQLPGRNVNDFGSGCERTLLRLNDSAWNQ